jgi:hypothetical protein
MFHQANAPDLLFPTGKADPRAAERGRVLGFADASIVTVALPSIRLLGAEPEWVGDHLNVPAPKGA